MISIVQSPDTNINMTFRCPNGQYYFERIPLSQNIEYRVFVEKELLTIIELSNNIVCGVYKIN